MEGMSGPHVIRGSVALPEAELVWATSAMLVAALGAGALGVWLATRPRARALLDRLELSSRPWGALLSGIYLLADTGALNWLLPRR